MAPSVKPRRIGQRKHDLNYGHLLTNGPHIRPPTPEDLLAPPLGSSDEGTPKEDSDFDEFRATKRLKRSSDEKDIKIKSRSSSPPGQSQTTSLACEPSNIVPSSFTTIKSENDDELDGSFSSYLRSSQSKKNYGRGLKNIHTAVPKSKQKKDVKKASKPAQSRGVTEFKSRDLGDSLLLGIKIGYIGSRCSVS